MLSNRAIAAGERLVPGCAIKKTVRALIGAAEVHVIRHLRLAWRPCYYANVIQSLAHKGSKDVFNGRNTHTARKACPRMLGELRIPPGNRLEELVYNRRGQRSIRINQRYRICFNGPKAGLWMLKSRFSSEGCRRKRMLRVPKNREPTHPGETILEEFLEPTGLSQQSLSSSIRVSYQRINEIVNGRRGIIPATAFRLRKYFGNTAAEIYCNSA